MKKFIFTLSALFCISASMYAATDTISASGHSFVPSNLTVNVGDTVLFELSSMHNAAEVTQATWNANGATSNGGFQVPYGGGMITMTDTGTFYYVCQAHASHGMKGIIKVLDTATGTAPNTIVNVGDQFVPDTLTVMPGDTITFNLESMHNAVEVSQATWNANGNSANGGFQVPYGGGQITLSTPGIHYYVCQTHANLGMKGVIIVMDTATSVHEMALSGYSMKLYPNPAQRMLHINGTVPKNINNLSVGIHAVDGRLLNELKIVTQDGEFSTNLNVEKLPSGIYFLSVWNDQIGTIFNKKITIK